LTTAACGGLRSALIAELEGSSFISCIVALRTDRKYRKALVGLARCRLAIPDPNVN
jgi:hypothetical protein